MSSELVTRQETGLDILVQRSQRDPQPCGCRLGIDELRFRMRLRRIFNFPYDAIEEAVVNAVYHRSYEIREPIEIRISPEEFVVLSFPGPDRSIKLTDLERGKAVSRRYRNRRIGEFLKELDLTEGRATGTQIGGGTKHRPTPSLTPWQNNAPGMLICGHCSGAWELRPLVPRLLAESANQLNVTDLLLQRFLPFGEDPVRHQCHHLSDIPASPQLGRHLPRSERTLLGKSAHDGGSLDKRYADVLMLNLSNELIFTVANQDSALIASKNIGEREVVERSWGNAAGRSSVNYQWKIKPFLEPYQLRKLPKFTAIIRHCEKPYRKRLLPPITPDGNYPNWFRALRPDYTLRQWFGNFGKPDFGERQLREYQWDALQLDQLLHGQ